MNHPRITVGPTVAVPPPVRGSVRALPAIAGRRAEFSATKQAIRYCLQQSTIARYVCSDGADPPWRSFSPAAAA